jgi:hypothetical protein
MSAKSKSKSLLATGVCFILASFICVSLIFYLMGHMNMTSMNELSQIKEELTVLDIEKTNSQKELKDVKEQLNTINLEQILGKAQTVYSAEESQRKEGLLWIDQKTSRYVVTLGALNGLHPGSALGVYDGSRRVGEVIVDTPLDVISYVRPDTNSTRKLKDNNYRVVIE